MSKRLISKLLIAVLGVSLCSGCGGSGGSQSTPASQQPAQTAGSAAPASGAENLAKGSIVMKFGTVVNESHINYQAIVDFGVAVEERTNGVIDFQLYPAGQLGGEREMVESLLFNNLEVFFGGSMVVGNFTNKVKFWSLPFFFSGGRDACFEFFDEFGQDIADGIYEDIGAYTWFCDNGSFNPANSVRPIKSVSDMKGLKVRCHEVDTMVKGYEALGASAVPMAFTEVYTALQQGTINGTNTNAQLMESNKFYEVCKYYSPINLYYDMAVHMYNGPWFDALPEEFKTILTEEIVILDNNCNDNLKTFLVGVDERLQDGLVEYSYLTRDELATFVAAVQPAYDWFRGQNIEPNFERYYEAAQKINEKYLK